MSATSPPPAPARSRPRPSRTRALTGALVALVVGGAAGLALLLAAGGGPRPSPVGIPDPGATTAWLVPASGFLGQVLTVAVVGSLMTPLLVMTAVTDELRGTAFRAVRAVRYLALGWAAVVAAEIALTVSDQYALPVWRLSWPLLSGFVLDVDQGRMMSVQLVLALAVALASRWVLSVRESSALLGVALLAIVPPVFTGHSAASGSHDLAIVSLLLHVLVIVVWTGGLVALWWHLQARPVRRVVAARRFSSLAAWCFAIAAASGAANALVRTGGLGPLVTTGYGVGVVAKILTLGLVGLVALQVRRVVRAGDAGRNAADGDETDGRRTFARLAGVELVVLFVAIGLGVALSRTPPPVGDLYPTLAESLVGGSLPPAPTIGRLVLGLQASGVGIAVVSLGLALYVAGVLTLRRRGDRWSMGRSLSWAAGLLVVAYATCGGLGVYSHVMFSAHMAAHMLLSMVAPTFLVLGAPITLALRALPGADEPGGTGPRQMLAGLLRSRPLRLLTHPLVAAALFAGSVYVVYLTGLFDVLMANHLGHAFMELHFLLVGLLFFEVLVGSAPIPRPPFVGRVALLILIMPLHAFFAITVMASTTVIGGDFYSLLDRGYATDLLADQNLGGSLTWALGEVPMVILLLVILTLWYREDSRDAERYDRRAARDDDAELVAYNERLRRMSRHEASAADRAP